MRIGTVVGNVWATRKEEGLQGLKLLIIELKNSQGGTNSFEQIVAADRIGAGVGDDVIITLGSSASLCFRNETDYPIDAIVVGIIDSSKIERSDKQ